MEREYLSSNHFSHEGQVRDVLRWMQREEKETYSNFAYEHPEWERMERGEDIQIGGEALGDLDPEWWHWVTDWIEANTNVVWDDGEPVLITGEPEESDCAE